KYEDMLNNVYKQMPDSVKNKERFVIPLVKGHLEGNKTVISNLKDIVQTLGRDQDHVVKFLLKELAAPGEIKGNLFIIGTKTTSVLVNEKIKNYDQPYVICNVCGKPDTKIVKENGLYNLICQACGNKQAIRG